METHMSILSDRRGSLRQSAASNPWPARPPPDGAPSIQGSPKNHGEITQRRTVLTQYGEEISVEELAQEHASELPGRDLLMGISLLGIPLVGIADLTVLVNTIGPNWLACL